jgi:hypothetical protein
MQSRRDCRYFVKDHRQRKPIGDEKHNQCPKNMFEGYFHNAEILSERVDLRNSKNQTRRIQRRRRDIFVAPRTTQNQSSVGAASSAADVAPAELDSFNFKSTNMLRQQRCLL